MSPAAEKQDELIVRLVGNKKESIGSLRVQLLQPTGPTATSRLFSLFLVNQSFQKLQMYSLALLAAFFIHLIIKPFFDYFRDPKRLRRYPNYNLLCEISNVGWCLETWRGGIRSKKLSEMHKKHPVIRIGPSSLSYGDLSAIKDIYGHGTKCYKDVFYQTEAGSHFNIGNVIDKQDHARKRKMLEGAFAMKNVQTWEYKVAENIAHFIEACDKHCTAPLPESSRHLDPKDLTLDFRAWTNFFTIDAIADITLSEKLGMLRTGNDLVPARL